MPGWKKNIPACLQPDQEGGKTGPDRPALVHTDRARVRLCVTIPVSAVMCIYSVCVCTSPRTS